MHYEFIMNGQNKIIFQDALDAAKKLLDLCLVDNYRVPFFQTLYVWLSFYQNEKSISLTKEHFLSFKKRYWGYGININTFLNSFQEVKNINSFHITQQAVLTHHYNSQIERNQNQQEKEKEIEPLIARLSINKTSPK